MFDHFIFGSENARFDELLSKCKINNSILWELPLRIIVGRWGAGKSAALFIQSQKLTEKLSSINEEIKYVWYVAEHELEFSILAKEFESVFDQLAFRKYLERIWTAEILRRVILILGHLDNYYGNRDSIHWKFIRTTFKSKNIGETLWKQLPSALAILKKMDSDQINALESITDEISKLFKKESFELIQKCLGDIKDYDVQPIVAIEPLDRPNSALDKEISLAQEVVNSLLNVFEEKFHPLENKPQIKVFLAIPWHRYEKNDTNFPQHLKESVFHLTWDKHQLQKLINERIKWEFERVGRQKYDKNNPWEDLFEKKVQRDNFKPSIIEPSFAYLLRHTHYRPRDIIRITRLCVVEEAIEKNITPDEVLRTCTILGPTIRKAIHKFRTESFNDLEVEINRRFKNFSELKPFISGLPVSFSTDNFAKKIRQSQFSYDEAINILWYSGIIGVEATCKDKVDEEKDLESLLPQKNKKVDTNFNKESIIRWYYFEYNCDENPIGLINKLSNSPLLNMNLVFHPKTLNSLAGATSVKWPVGI